MKTFFTFTLFTVVTICFSQVKIDNTLLKQKKINFTEYSSPSKLLLFKYQSNNKLDSIDYSFKELSEKEDEFLFLDKEKTERLAWEIKEKNEKGNKEIEFKYQIKNDKQWRDEINEDSKSSIFYCDKSGKFLTTDDKKCKIEDDEEKKTCLTVLYDSIDPQEVTFFKPLVKKDFNHGQLIVHDFHQPYTKKNRTRVSRGEIVKHLFLNYDQKYSEVKIKSQNFKNFHLESAERFSNLALKPKNTNTKEIVDKPKDSTLGAINYQGTDSSSHQILDILNTNLKAYVGIIRNQNKYASQVSIDYAVFKEEFKRIFTCITTADNNEVSQALKDLNYDIRKSAEIMSNLNFIQQYTNNALSLGIEMRDSDEYVVDFEFIPKDTTLAKETRRYTYPIMNGFKIDFSTGIVMSYLTDDRFQIVDTDPRMEVVTENGEDMTQSIDQKQVITGNSDKFNVGIGILAHAYTRITPYVNGALSFGFVIEDDAAVNWPLGLSLLLGRESRIVLTGGVLFGQVQRLNDKYELNTPEDATFFQGINDDQLTVQQFQARPFFSITYNLGGIQIANKK